MNIPPTVGQPNHALRHHGVDRLVNPEAERAVNGGLCRLALEDLRLTSKAIVELGISVDLFTQEESRALFTAITTRIVKGVPVDLATLRNATSQAVRIEFETSLSAHASAANLPVYVQLLHNAYHARQRHVACTALAKLSTAGADLSTLRAALSELERIEAKGQQAQEGLALEHSDTLTLKAVQWLWKDWLARGKLHLLGGLPGTGKTTLALALAATVSSGGRFPDGSYAKPGRVVIWSSEDDVEDTLLPRLVANGADRSRIAFCRTVREKGKQRLFDPATDLPLLQAALEKLGDTDLVILDSIADTVTGDSHKNAEVRRALFPVKELAEAAHLAVLGIAHFNKSVGSDAMSRIVGSIGFSGMARLVMVAFAHPAHGHLLMRAKSNLGLDHGGYQYEIQQTPLHDHPGIEASLVLWGTRVEGNATDLLRQAETGDNRPTDDSGDWGVQLLTDLHAYFADRKVDKVWTVELLRYLTDLDDASWSTFANGKAMTARHIARLLHPYGIKPDDVRIGTAVAKGYTVADFADAFAKYLPLQRYSATSSSSTGKSPDQLSATDPLQRYNLSATNAVCSGYGLFVADCSGYESASLASQQAGCSAVADVADKQPPAAQPVDFTGSPQADRIRAILEGIPNGLAQRDLAFAAACSEPMVKLNCHRLMMAGKVILRDGRYVAV
jgi:putative DNA primase/helicase